jgi:hypothetical protein
MLHLCGCMSPPFMGLITTHLIKSHAGRLDTSNVPLYIGFT